MADGFIQELREAFAPRYLVAKQIGSGGSSIVVLAHDVEHDREVAIKVLRPELKLGTAARRAYLEVDIAKQIKHPNILELFDDGTVLDGLPFSVMPYMANGTLRNKMPKGTKLDIDFTISTARAIAEGLEAAHAQNIIHRDIKPENILIADDGTLKIADFGIGRILDSDDTRETTYGAGIGTVLYISPEQAQGARDVDARTDQYALATIVYEMLAGEPPFTGVNAETIIRKKLGMPPPSVRPHRETVSEAFDQTVSKGLASAPADRHHSATTFVRRLTETIHASPYHRSARPRRLMAWGLAAAGITAIAIFAGERFADPTVSNRVMLVGTPIDAPPDERVEFHISTLVSQVPGVRLLPPAIVRDRIARDSASQVDVESLDTIARELGAGAVVHYTTATTDSGLQVDVRAVRLADSTVLPRSARATRMLAIDKDDWGAALAPVIENLFDIPRNSLGYHGNVSGRAIHFYVEARRSLEQAWDLAAADSLAQMAVEEAPRFSSAHLLLANVRRIRGADAAHWLDHARAALADPPSSPSWHSDFAQGLIHLGEGRMRDACDTFRSVLDGDSTVVVVLLAYGDCQRLDNTVIPNPESRSSFSFRGSHHAALVAYSSALRAVPSFNFSFRGNAYEGLIDILGTRANKLRIGHHHSDPNRLFAAYATLEGDTIAFVPYPIEEVLRAEPHTVPDTRADAQRYTRRRLADVVEVWAEAFPRSPQANMARARAQEAIGNLGPGRGSALDAVQLARSLARDSLERAAAMHLHLRLLVKTKSANHASHLADTLLAALPQPTEEWAVRLSGVAALVGQANRAADLLEQGVAFTQKDNRYLQLVVRPVAVARERLRAFVAVGAPRDSIREVMARAERLLEDFVRGTEKEDIARGLLDDVSAWAFPVFGRTAQHRPDAPNRLLGLQERLVQQDRQGLSSMLADLRATRALDRPGDLSPDRFYHEMWLTLQVGDSAAAAAELQRYFGAIETISASFLDEPQQAAAMARFAALAATVLQQHGAGDVAADAQRFANALWRSADAEASALITKHTGGGGGTSPD